MFRSVSTVLARAAAPAAAAAERAAPLAQVAALRNFATDPQHPDPFTEKLQKHTEEELLELVRESPAAVAEVEGEEEGDEGPRVRPMGGRGRAEAHDAGREGWRGHGRRGRREAGRGEA